jgi:nucleoid-associated protein YgaU
MGWLQLVVIIPITFSQGQRLPDEQRETKDLLTQLICGMNMTDSSERFLLTVQVLEAFGPQAKRALPYILDNAERLRLFNGPQNSGSRAIITQAVLSIARPPTATVAHPTATGKTVRIGPDGELLWKLAERVLGDGQRWVDIYRLNPNLNADRPLPAGTEVRLPADAKVPK